MQIIQIVYGVIPSRIARGPETLRAAFPSAQYKLIECPAIEDPIQRCIASDKLRFELARIYGEQMMYADLDVEVLKSWDIEPGPHFAFRRDQPACFLFYGLNTRILDWMDEERKRRHISLDTYCWPTKVLRDNQTVYRIPEDCYKHYEYTKNANKNEESIRPQGELHEAQ